MEMIQNVGLIECGNSTMPSLSNDFVPVKGFRIKKILASHSSTEKLAKELYPEVEVVTSRSSILEDDSISLVIVASPEKNDMSLVAEAVGAGKQVRVL